MKPQIKEALESNKKDHIGNIFSKIDNDLDVELHKKLPLIIFFCSLIVGITRWTRRTCALFTSPWPLTR
jgi:hypothetical protein